MLTKLKLWIEKALSIAEEVAPIVEKDAPKPRPCLPPGLHAPHEPGSVLQSRQLDPRPFLRLDNARPDANCRADTAAIPRQHQGISSK